MSDIRLVSISTATLCDRLRKIKDELTNENRHTDALLIDFAIQALKAEPNGLPQIVSRVMAQIEQRAWMGRGRL